LASVGREEFEVALIPTTLAVTTLGDLKMGDRVNVECDIVSKTIVHSLKRMKG
jgi:riboflavin synthase